MIDHNYKQWRGRRFLRIFATIRQLRFPPRHFYEMTGPARDRYSGSAGEAVTSAKRIALG